MAKPKTTDLRLKNLLTAKDGKLVNVETGAEVKLARPVKAPMMGRPWYEMQFHRRAHPKRTTKYAEIIRIVRALIEEKQSVSADDIQRFTRKQVTACLNYLTRKKEVCKVGGKYEITPNKKTKLQPKLI